MWKKVTILTRLRNTYSTDFTVILSTGLQNVVKKNEANRCIASYVSPEVLRYNHSYDQMQNLLDTTIPAYLLFIIPEIRSEMRS